MGSAFKENQITPNDDTSIASRRRILVVDDNQDAADSLALILELAGHDVRVAHGGTQALELAHSFHPDVALLDIGMPGLSGYDVAIRLRAEPWARGMRLIAMTGWGHDRDRQRAKDAGFDQHLTKPFDIEELHRALVAPTVPP